MLSGLCYFCREVPHKIEGVFSQALWEQHALEVSGKTHCQISKRLIGPNAPIAVSMPWHTVFAVSGGLPAVSDELAATVEMV